MILRFTSPPPEKLIDDLTRCFEDYLRRAKEPYGIVQQWAMITRALLRSQDQFLFLVAFDRHVRPIGYMTAHTATDLWGTTFAVTHQAYVRKGHPGVSDEFNKRFTEWAEAIGADVCSGITYRHSPGFQRWFGKMGFVPCAVWYIRPMKKESSNEEPTVAPSAAGS